MSCPNNEVLNEQMQELAEEAGLTFCGFEGEEPQFIGDDKAWDKWDKLNNIYE